MRQVYVVDDDDAVRHSFELLLSAVGGMAVRGFASGDAFLAAAPALARGCLLLDLNMPGTDGLGVLAAIRERALPFAVVVLTGNADIRAAVAAMKAGAADFIEKPCDNDALLATIERAGTDLERAGRAAERMAAARRLIDALSARERDVLMKLVEGRQNKQTALELGISYRTVEIHRANLMEKLGARSISEALRLAIDAGLIGAGN